MGFGSNLYDYTSGFDMNHPTTSYKEVWEKNMKVKKNEELYTLSILSYFGTFFASKFYVKV